MRGCVRVCARVYARVRVHEGCYLETGAALDNCQRAGPGRVCRTWIVSREAICIASAWPDCGGVGCGLPK